MSHSLTLSESSTPRVGRGRVQLLLILAVVIGPMLLASAMYHWRFWVPEGRSYHGELIGGALSRADLGLPVLEENRWQLLVTAPGECAADCQRLVYLARQIHIGLGREAARGAHALATVSTPEDFATQLAREYPQLQRFTLDTGRYPAERGQAAQLWIVDPHGNLVLRYDADANGKQVLTDLRLLLKLSNIG